MNQLTLQQPRCDRAWSLALLLAALTPALCEATGKTNELIPVVIITNSPVPRIQMENVSLEEAIRKLAREAKLNIILDPKLADPSVGPRGGALARSIVSFDLQNVTPGQALTALLDNYDLVLIEEASVSAGRLPIPEPTRDRTKPARNGERKPGKD